MIYLMKYLGRGLLLAVLAGTPCFAAATGSGEADFYVSTAGSDDWSGTLADPNGQNSDGPFASLERARDAVRDLKKQKDSDILVQVRGGMYRLDETVVFGLEDSGNGDSTITYAAYPGETPIFSSGREIKGWKPADGPLPGLPAAAQGKVQVADAGGRFKTLYDDRGHLPRARSAGFIPTKKGKSTTEVHYPEGRLKNWPNLEDVEIVVRPFHAWIMNILPLASVDEEARVARTALEATYQMDALHFLKTTDSCWIENVLDELDKPGEWVLNTREDKLYLWPRSDSPVLAPQLLELIRVEGAVDRLGPEDVPARNLCFRGLTFKHGDRYSLTPDDAGLQHDWDMLDKGNALVRFRGTENCVIEQCHFLHSGSGAIRVDLYGQKNTISGNHIEHMGGGGILLCGYGPGTKDVNKENLVYNNHVHHVGLIYWHSPGIFLWQSGENRVANNLIHHTPYSGLILSGFITDVFEDEIRELTRTVRWHEIGQRALKTDTKYGLTLEEVRPFLHSHDNVLEYNEIHNVMEKMGDGNGIYLRGGGSHNVIRRNFVHHLVTPMIMQVAVRTDGGQLDSLIAENVIYKCSSQGIMMKLNTRVENNIVADVIAPPRGYYLSVREGPLTGGSIQRNIFYSSNVESVFVHELEPKKKGQKVDGRGRLLARAEQADTDHNIYYNTVDPELGVRFLEQQQAKGIDANSRAVDPLFVDPDNGDFRFKPGSPALEMGIVPIDLSKTGLRNEGIIEPGPPSINHPKAAE